jgi:hypothetical protein
MPWQIWKKPAKRGVEIGGNDLQLSTLSLSSYIVRTETIWEEADQPPFFIGAVTAGRLPPTSF